MSKTRWGQLHNKPSGVIYLDLTFHQPADCKLAEATITMNFEHAYAIRDLPAENLEVTEFFGPKILSGEKRERQVSTTLEVNPKVGTGGINIEGGGWSQRSDTSYASRWKFTGSRFAAEPSSSHDALNSRSSQYQQLVWHLDENELDNQAIHHSTVHSAVAFHHDSEPFFLDLQIEVNRKACTRASIHPTSDVNPDPNFAELASNLDHAMIDMNLHPVVEVPDPTPKLVDASCEDKENDTETSARCLPNENLIALVGQLTGQGTLTFGETRPTSFMDSSTSTLVESNTTKEPEEQADPDTTIAEPKDTLTPGPPNQQDGFNGMQKIILRAVISVLCQGSRFLATVIASFILGLNGLHSVLVQLGK
ncbi:hypothetical protein PENSOL_c107G06355 [Penicillium solitum]|uniref:Uncharacterized protein n=1 Tax=Penicillium solitum TaxID=60172 RepID=A0A1V6Q7F8_9EURO|nr:uncharacterized protein PENSOL_c107G06355 [Penicillium solitum]OQD85149.1 hypothetical protein PENSOL_c107G06355 [Penicillium solitum]